MPISLVGGQACHYRQCFSTFVYPLANHTLIKDSIFMIHDHLSKSILWLYNKEEQSRYSSYNSPPN